MIVFSSKAGKMTVGLLSLVSFLASTKAVSAEPETMADIGGDALLRGGRFLYSENMHDSSMTSQQQGQQHDGDMMMGNHNGSAGMMMDWNGTNDHDGDNMTFWHDNSTWMHNHDGDKDNHYFGNFMAPSSRHCNTQQMNGEMECSCMSNMTEMMSDFEDEINFKVRAIKGDYLSIMVDYVPDAFFGTNQSDARTDNETQFTLVFESLLEYRKVGNAADDHYEWGVDQVVAEWPLNDWEELSADPSSDSNMIVYTAKSSMVTFTFHIAQANMNGMNANKMKIDFLLENYPWNATEETYIALITRLETERKIEMNMEQGTDKVSDVKIKFKDAMDEVGFIPFGEYTWATTAEATDGSNTGSAMDGMNGTASMMERGAMVGDNQTTSIPVVASIATGTSESDNSTGEEIAFSFVGAGQGASRIYWDPEAGIGYKSTSSSTSLSSSSSSSISTFASSAAALVASVGLMWWM